MQCSPNFWSNVFSFTAWNVIYMWDEISILFEEIRRSPIVYGIIQWQDYSNVLERMKDIYFWNSIIEWCWVLQAGLPQEKLQISSALWLQLCHCASCISPVWVYFSLYFISVKMFKYVKEKKMKSEMQRLINR